MNTKPKEPHDEQPDKEHNPNAGSDPSGEGPERATSEDKDLLAKANAAIKEALSSDNEIFLKASRQTCGGYQ